MASSRDRHEAHRARRRASITRQALIGFAIVLAGCVWGIVVVQEVGQQALDADATPLYGPLVVVGVGSIVVTIAAYRKLFMAPAAFLRKEAGSKLLDEISDLLD